MSPRPAGAQWFAPPLPPPPGDAVRLEAALRDSLAGTGWPQQPVLPAAPIAMPPAAYAELFDAAVLLAGLLRRAAWEAAPRQDFDGGVYTMPPSERRLFGPDPLVDERFADAIMRPDVVIGEDGPRFLEFNVSGGLGGVLETHSRLRVLRDAYRSSDVRFASPDPFEVRAGMFRSIARERGLPDRVAIVGSPQVAGVEERYFTLERDHLRRSGFDAEVLGPDELLAECDRPARDRFALGHRNLTNGDWAAAGLPFDALQQVIDDGCLLVGTQRACVLHHKATLGLVSEGRPWMTDAERAAVDRYLPWTRIVGDRRTRRGGRDIELAGFAASHQHELVLKAGWGESGEQVTIGRDVTAAQWSAALDEAILAGDAIVQDLVEPRRCDVALVADGETSTARVAPVLGPLLFGGRPAGVFARFQPDGSAGIVNVRGAVPSADGVAVAA